jgi:hypothetical protein
MDSTILGILAVLLIFYSFAAFGFCWIVGHARVTQIPREWIATQANLVSDFRSGGEKVIGYLLELIECPACLGWWVGVTTGCLLLVAWPYPVPLFSSHFFFAGFDIFALGCYTAGVNFCLGRATGLIREEE